MKLLVIDDEKDMLTLFKQKYRKRIREGMIDFHFAENGKDAQELLSSEDFGKDDDIVFIDYNLPDDSGLQLLKKIKSDYPLLRAYIVTGMTDEKTRTACDSAGADGFIEKPIEFENLDSIFDSE